MSQKRHRLRIYFKDISYFFFQHVVRYVPGEGFYVFHNADFGKCRVVYAADYYKYLSVELCGVRPVIRVLILIPLQPAYSKCLVKYLVSPSVIRTGYLQYPEPVGSAIINNEILVINMKTNRTSSRSKDILICRSFPTASGVRAFISDLEPLSVSSDDL